MYIDFRFEDDPNYSTGKSLFANGVFVGHLTPSSGGILWGAGLEPHILRHALKDREALTLVINEVKEILQTSKGSFVFFGNDIGQLLTEEEWEQFGFYYNEIGAYYETTDHRKEIKEEIEKRSKN